MSILIASIEPFWLKRRIARDTKGAAESIFRLPLRRYRKLVVLMFLASRISCWGPEYALGGTLWVSYDGPPMEAGRSSHASPGYKDIFGYNIFGYGASDVRHGTLGDPGQGKIMLLIDS
ncbi:uncharacterized protein BDZ99DRAFT_470114 [Mytilinidion resinicola]|uniref:Uncharacterized protein n=1 Tax=Mytilinidion resinicola TaxID=574789 RepID=A0A6A6Z7S1_9PEZI|nr:uncharacterized protein BDZ99DRAFT_470114 [Mytilinidion resinicola]KAF2817050.1 hypothetical protein BDZ99DRAFT_470114 [Mytilinidion resinicola]